MRHVPGKQWNKHTRWWCLAVQSTAAATQNVTAQSMSPPVLSLLWTCLPAPWGCLPNAGETIIISKRCLCSRLIPTSPLRKSIQFFPHISGASFHDLTQKKKSKIEHIGGNQPKNQDSAMVSMKSREEWVMSRAELWKPSPSWQKIDLLCTVQHKWQRVEQAIPEAKRLCDMSYLKRRGAERQIHVLVTFILWANFWVCVFWFNKFEFAGGFWFLFCVFSNSACYSLTQSNVVWEQGKSWAHF